MGGIIWIRTRGQVKLGQTLDLLEDLRGVDETSSRILRRVQRELEVVVG